MYWKKKKKGKKRKEKEKKTRKKTSKILYSGGEVKSELLRRKTFNSPICVSRRVAGISKAVMETARAAINFGVSMWDSRGFAVGGIAPLLRGTRMLAMYH